MISLPLVKFVLTAARRDKLMITLLLMMVIGASLAAFLGGGAIDEQASFAIVFGAGGLRFLGVIGIVLFCCFYIRRSFETKEVEFLLSRPVSRTTFLFSHAFSFMLLALFVTAMLVVCLCFLGRPDPGGLTVWGLSMAMENMIMAVAALFFSMVLSSASGSALATLGVYVLSRLIGTLIGIAAMPAETWVVKVLSIAMNVVSTIVPRLDMMGQTSWLIYGVKGSGGIGFLEHARPYAQYMIAHIHLEGFIVLQGVVFIALLLGAASFDFSRREF